MRILQNGTLLIISANFPPARGGSSVVMGNLLRNFDPQSYHVVTKKNNKFKGNQNLNLYSIYSDLKLPVKINQFFQKVQIPLANNRLKKIINHVKPSQILSIYPEFFHLKSSFDVSNQLGIPNSIYFHDALYEGLFNSYLENSALELQQQIFRKTKNIFVISDGLRDLFNEKYKTSSIILRHIYNGAQNTSFEEINNRQAFYCGSIYGINFNSLRRASQALANEGYDFNISTITNYYYLLRKNIVKSKKQIKFIPEVSEFLSHLNKQQILIVALDWPDESTIHKDELSTIFPTKMMEYLSSGRPILAHCPENYFLAKFIINNSCGLVSSDPSIENLSHVLRKLNNSSLCKELGQNAINSSSIFRGENTSLLLYKTLNSSL